MVAAGSGSAMLARHHLTPSAQTGQPALRPPGEEPHAVQPIHEGIAGGAASTLLVAAARGDSMSSSAEVSGLSGRTLPAEPLADEGAVGMTASRPADRATAYGASLWSPQVDERIRNDPVMQALCARLDALQQDSLPAATAGDSPGPQTYGSAAAIAAQVGALGAEESPPLMLDAGLRDSMPALSAESSCSGGSGVHAADCAVAIQPLPTAEAFIWHEAGGADTPYGRHTVRPTKGVEAHEAMPVSLRWWDTPSKRFLGPFTAGRRWATAYVRWQLRAAQHSSLTVAAVCYEPRSPGWLQAACLPGRMLPGRMPYSLHAVPIGTEQPRACWFLPSLAPWLHM